MNEQPKLKDCPACGAGVRNPGSGFVACMSNLKCPIHNIRIQNSEWEKPRLKDVDSAIVELRFCELSTVCGKRVPTEAWFDSDEAPPWDWTCTRGDWESENPSFPVLGKEQECNQENCPVWRRFQPPGKGSIPHEPT